jgi:hypothetical protein
MHEKFTSEIQLNPTKRLARLEYLRTQLKGGTDVAKRDLKNVLTEQEWCAYEERRKNELQSLAQKAPKQIKKYASMKKVADLAFARAEAHSIKNPASLNRAKNHRMYEIHDHYSKRALEYLKECLGQNLGLIEWLYAEEPHRSVVEAINANVLPKLVTTRTILHTASRPMPKSSIRDMKIDAINSALDSLSGEPSQELDWLEISQVKKRDFSKFKV